MITQDSPSLGPSTGAEALVRMLELHGVKYIFGLCGDTSLPFYDALQRLDAMVLGEAGWPADFAPSCYVCGPTGFVEAVADMLVSAGHAPERIKTERFGPSGG